jgi:hypothetical protein
MILRPKYDPRLQINRTVQTLSTWIKPTSATYLFMTSIHTQSGTLEFGDYIFDFAIGLSLFS